MFDWADFLTAVCLMAIFEGVTPFLSPRLSRAMAMRMAGASDGEIRMIGFVVMLGGLLGLMLVR